MTFSEYVELAARTDREHKDRIDGIRNAAMGMVGEAAETLEHVKKVLDQGHELNIDKLVEEAGDTLWYIAKMSRYCGVPLEYIAAMNIKKLRGSYPDGFSRERSVGRDG